MEAKGKLISLLAAAAIAVATAVGCLALPATAFGLETPPYTPGEDYRIDEEEAFRDQGIEHEEAAEGSASTQYYLTSPFYLEWISPDVTIYEGQEAYIGCKATGLEDLRYEWRVSSDGGATFKDAGLIGNEHVLAGLTANDPETQPYLYRCTITNGDGTSTLEADVQVTVLEPSLASRMAQTGDRTIGVLALAGAAGCAAIALAVAAGGKARRDDSATEDA